MATSMYEPKYMALALATKEWIWLTNTYEELNMLVTNAAMCCNKKTTLDIAYNHKTGHRSNHTDVAYYLVCENVTSGRISLLQIQSVENLADVCTNGPKQITSQKLRISIMDAN
jgi:hypothetical protein